MKLIKIYICALGIMAAGCESILDVESTRTVGEENMWNSLEDTRGALMGTYGLVRAAMADNNAHWLYGDVRPGEFQSPNRRDLKAIIANDLTASYPSIEALSNWRRWYAAINSANLFLERVGDVKAADPRYTDNNMRVDIAQIRFLRAFCYFYMTRIWGDVPLVLSSREGDFTGLPREDQAKVLAWAQEELKAAAEDLPYKYSAGDEQQPGNYYNEGEGRWAGALARKLTAYAVLAHLAAWEGDYASVANYTKFVIDNYPLGGNNWVNTTDLTNSNGLFYNKKYNQLFGLNFDYGHVDASFTGHIEELTLASPVVSKSVPDIFLPKDSILSIFSEEDDQRFSIDTVGQPTSERYFTNFNGKYPIFSKIKVIMNGGTDPSFRIFSSAIVFTRLEDVALLRAEALAALGETAGAIEMLNTVRELRGLERYSEELNGHLVDAIFKERQRELMGEGHRWYDLVRYHKIRNQDPDFRQLIESGGIYWPISREVLQQNGQIDQNPYWE